MFELGLVYRGTSVLVADSPPTLNMDPVTAARAWADCSPEAVAAYVENSISYNARLWGFDHNLSGARTEQLVALASLGLPIGDPRVAILVGEISAREDGAELAALLRAQADPDLQRAIDEEIAAHSPSAWEKWHHLQESGLLPDAEALLEDLAEDQESVDHPLRIAISRLVLSRLEPDEMVEKTLDLERQLLATADEGSYSSTEFDLLLALRQMRAAATKDLGRGKEAAEVLHRHFRETVAQGVASHLVIAGASAISALGTEGALSEAREVSEVIAYRTQAMRPTMEKIMALSAQLKLLLHEGRTLRAREAAEALIDEIGAWSSPRPGVLQDALSTCSLAFTESPESFVIQSLLQTYDKRGPEEPSSREDRLFADAFGETTLPELLSVASELADRLPLEALGVTRDEYLAGVATYFERLGNLDPMTSDEARLGDSALARLTSRATDGCRMSELILLSAQEGQEGEVRNAPADAAELRRLARRHGPLSEILSHLVLDNYALSLPATRQAFRGSRGARTVLTGLVIGDIQRGLSPTAIDSLLALGHGDGLQAQRELGLLPENVPLLCNVCVSIEDCHLTEGSAEEDAVSANVVAFARSGWQLVLAYADSSSAAGRTALRALGQGIAPPAELMAALVAAATGEATPQEALGVVAEDEPLTAEVLDRLDAQRPTQFAVASLALEEDSETAMHALRLIRHFADSADKALARRAIDKVLWSEMTKPEESRDLDSIATDLERLKLLYTGTELTAREKACHLTTISAAGFTLRRFEVAREAIEAALALPVEAMNARERHDFHFNHVQTNRILEGEAAGARALLEAGVEMGFLAACLIFLRAKIDPTVDSSLPFAEVFASLDPDPAADPNRASLAEVRLEFEGVVKDAPGWEAVTETVGAKTENG